MSSSIYTLLYPRSVAVIGASTKKYSVGGIIVENLLKLGFKGKIYPVNPKYSEVLSLKCYPSLKDVKEEVDVVVLAVSASKVPLVLEECGVKRVKFAVVIASGFSEIGGKGETLEAEVLRVARKYGIRVLGPNTTGILNLENGFTTAFTRIPKNVRRGKVSLIVQTGVFAASLLRWIITSEYLGLSKVIGLGNKIDIDEIDALEFLARDRETRVIMMYLEGVQQMSARVSRHPPWCT